MKKSVKKEWIKALRSGEYEQCTGVLYREGVGYCCLGVLYDACIDGEWVYRTVGPGQIEGWTTQSTDKFGESDLELGMDILNVVALSEREQCKLMDMNDKGQSFDQIADYIEETL